MAARIALSVFALASSIVACPDHDFHPVDGTALRKRADGQDWAYEASFNWGMINSSMWFITVPPFKQTLLTIIKTTLCARLE